MAGTTGLEPATSDVTGRRSNQTELRPRDVSDTQIVARRTCFPQNQELSKPETAQCTMSLKGVVDSNRR